MSKYPTGYKPQNHRCPQDMLHNHIQKFWSKFTHSFGKLDRFSATGKKFAVMEWSSLQTANKFFIRMALERQWYLYFISVFHQKISSFLFWFFSQENGGPCLIID